MSDGHSVVLNSMMGISMFENFKRDYLRMTILDIAGSCFPLTICLSWKFTQKQAMSFLTHTQLNEKCNLLCKERNLLQLDLFKSKRVERLNSVLGLDKRFLVHFIAE